MEPGPARAAVVRHLSAHGQPRTRAYVAPELDIECVGVLTEARKAWTAAEAAWQAACSLLCLGAIRWEQERAARRYADEMWSILAAGAEPMSAKQRALLAICNDVTHECRFAAAAPGPMFALDREPSPRELVAWLLWNDGNGDYPADCDSADDAWAWLENALRDELHPFAPESLGHFE